jgi:hypothetical protein
MARTPQRPVRAGAVFSGAAMENPLDLVRAYLDRRTSVAVLATTAPDGAPDVTLLVAARLTPEGLVAGGEEAGVAGETFRNLRRQPAAVLLVLDPIVDPRSRDGVRLRVEFLGAEDDGDELRHLGEWLATFAPGRRIVRRLLFKVLSVEPYRVGEEGPVLAR